MNNINTLEASLRPREIHTSWLQELPYGALLDKLRKATTENENELLQYISTQLPIVKIDLNSTTGDLHKLHIMTPEELEKIVIKAGVMQFSKPIKQTINQQDVKRIKQLIGIDLYQFALHDVPDEFSNSPILKHTQKITFNSLSPIIEAGIHTLNVVLQDRPNNCFLKLPKSWKKNDRKTKRQETDLREQRMQKKLLNKLIDVC